MTSLLHDHELILHDASPTLIAGTNAPEGFSLEPNIFAADCSAANCMGIHVHEGTSCVDADSQGGHYFFTDEDPW